MTITLRDTETWGAGMLDSSRGFGGGQQVVGQPDESARFQIDPCRPNGYCFD